MKDERVRQHIIDTVKDYFFSYGSNGVSMSKLAREMKMSKKTIYKYFKSKEELTLKVIEDTREKLVVKLDAVVHDPRLCLMEKIKRLIKLKVDILSQVKPPFMRDIDRHAVIKNSVNQIEDRIIPSHLGIILEQGQKEGLIRGDIDLNFFYEILSGAVNRIINFDALHRLSLSADKAAEMIFDVCLNGILVRGEESE